MPFSLELRERTSQPTDLPRVSQKWIARGLVALFDLRSGVEIFTGTLASANTSTTTATKVGKGRDFSGTANVQFPHRPSFAITGDITIAALVDVDALTNYGAIIAKGPVSANVSYELRLGVGSTDSRIDFVRANSSVKETRTAANALSAGYSGLIVATRKEELTDTTGVFYSKNGKSALSSTAGTGTGVPTDNGATVWIGRRSDGATQLDGRIYYVALFNKFLPDGAAQELVANPWQIFEEEDFGYYAPAGGGVSGTLATTNANDTSAATGTTTVTGTLATTNANDSSSASGTTTVTGTLATTNANDTSAASGSPVVVGTLATTNANDSVVASGDVGGNITGTVNYTNANDTSAASGTTTVTGSLATTNANDSASASGTTTVTGTSAYTNANDSVVASGAAGTVTGTVNVTNANDTADAYGIGAPNNDSGDGSMSRKRYYLRRKGKILLFDTAAQADDYLEAEEEAQKAITAAKSRGAKKRIAAKILKTVEPVESVEIAPLQELVKAYSVPVNLPQLLTQQDYQQVMDVRAMIQRIQDDEDDELLLLLA